MKRLMLGVTDSGKRGVVEWNDNGEPVQKQFYQNGIIYRTVMTMSVEHVELAAEWKSARPRSRRPSRRVSR